LVVKNGSKMRESVAASMPGPLSGAENAPWKPSRPDKGKSAIHVARVYGERQRNFADRHSWARGYFVSTVGRGGDPVPHPVTGVSGPALLLSG
jgi:hypothetical protein